MTKKSTKTDKFIRPIVEYFPISPVESKHGARSELFTEFEDNGTTHRYYKGVRDALYRSYGIYIFYDSRGRALYAGKAVRQSLWKEMNSVFNRSRDEVQRIKLVGHPARNVEYRENEEKIRRIVNTPMKLHDLSAYFSAYEIAPAEMISMFEALIIRAFANDLLNVKMERL